MQARELMTRPVITFHPDTPIKHAAAVLTERQITAAPVVNSDDEIIGMVSEADLIVDRFLHDPRSHSRPVEPEPPLVSQTVGQVMTTTVVAMSPSADAADLAEAMVGYDVRSIPIVSGSTVLGIVSRRDLLRTLLRDDDSICTEVTDRLEAYTGHRTDWHVGVDNGRVRIEGDVDDEAEAKILRILAQTVPGVTHVEIGTVAHRR